MSLQFLKHQNVFKQLLKCYNINRYGIHAVYIKYQACLYALYYKHNIQEQSPSSWQKFSPSI